MPQPDAEGNEPSEEEKAAVQKKIDETTKLNHEAEKFNEEITKLQSKIKIEYRKMVDPKNECALMRINNYRENKSEDTIEPANVSQDLSNQSYHKAISQNKSSML